MMQKLEALADESEIVEHSDFSEDVYCCSYGFLGVRGRLI